jgi:hypothetical protein
MLKRFADSSQQDFIKSIPQLHKILGNPSTERPDQATLKEIAKKLNQTPQDSPEYWPTVLRFSQFASSLKSAKWSTTARLSSDQY